MLNAAIYIVFAILLIVCCLLLLVVLMQRPKNEGLGAAFGAQMTDQAFGAQTTDVLKKGTVLFGTLFMLLSFILGVLMNAKFKASKSNLATTELTVQKAQKAEDAPSSNLESYTLDQTAAPATETTPATDAAPATETTPATDAAPATETTPAADSVLPALDTALPESAPAA